MYAFTEGGFVFYYALNSEALELLNVKSDALVGREREREKEV